MAPCSQTGRSAKVCGVPATGQWCWRLPERSSVAPQSNDAALRALDVFRRHRHAIGRCGYGAQGRRGKRVKCVMHVTHSNGPQVAAFAPIPTLESERGISPASPRAMPQGRRRQCYPWAGGMVLGFRILAGAAGLPAHAGRSLSGRVPRGGPAVPGADRGARHAAGARVRRTGAVPRGALGLSTGTTRTASSRCGRGAGRCWPRRVAAGAADAVPLWAAMAAVGRAVGAVSVDRERRADLVRLRLGVAAAGGGLAGGVPRQRRDRSAGAGACGCCAGCCSGWSSAPG